MTQTNTQTLSVRRTPRGRQGIHSLAIWLPAILLFASTLPAVAHEGHGEDAGTAFASIAHHYEALWRSLAADSLDGAAEHAEGIREAADSIAGDFSREKAGLSEGASVEEATAFFSAISESALYLGSAADLDTAREAFYEISKAMVRLNEQLEGERLKVVYCSMTRKSWLQRQEKIVNPYHGRAMSGCGEVVAS